jgi:XapX domain-containing protein
VIWVKALGVGIAVGIIARVCGLPVPAPPTLAGVLCVAGITFGFWVWGLR